MTSDGQQLDIVTIGRSSVDLYGQQSGGRLEDMSSFAKYVGGCPANIAIGTARLGLRSAIITKVGDDHMGRFIAEQFEREGVSGDGVLSDPERLTALVVLGIRDEEQFPLIFYRENCADMALTAEDVDRDLITSSAATLVTGTLLSQAGPKEACVQAIRFAKEANRKVVFDVDFRPVLWNLTSPDRGEDRFVSDAAVTQQLQAILPDCDLVVGTEEELHILGGVVDTIAAIKEIRSHTDAIIVCKIGPQGCVVFDKEIPDDLNGGLRGPGFPVEVFNVLGAGDAFLSGFLAGWLRGAELIECCRMANASGAIVVSRHGCAPASPTLLELEYFLSDDRVKQPALRNDTKLEHLHWTGTRQGTYSSLKILAIDHRTQLEDLAREAKCSVDRLADLKLMALKAVHKLADGDPSYGVLVDGRFGMRALECAADYPYWIGRPIEVPGSRPLEFESAGDVGMDLNQWPKNHVVKCLVYYHPNDPEIISERQQRQILRLFDACRSTGHELLLEIISSKHGPVEENSVSTVINKLYELGIYPDWWKLEAAADDATWRNIETAIAYNDQYCRGILVLGLAAEEEVLLKSFEIAARCSLVKGFAIGRTIFNGAAKKWLSDEISDAELIDELAQNFARLVDGWNTAKRNA